MPNRLKWMSTQDIIRQVPCSCVDGRTQGMRYSVAGGSLGLVMHALAAIGEQTKQQFTDEQITAYLQLFARQVAPLYLHSDSQAMALIWAKMALSETTRLQELDSDQLRSFIRLATQADFQGCGHIKLMLSHSQQYQINSELLQRILAAFFALYWAGEDNLVFDVLSGHHVEALVVLLHEQHSQDLAKSTALYYEDPEDENKFFCHRPLKRELMARFFQALKGSELKGLSEVQWQALALRHDQAAEMTLRHLAPDLPIEHLNL